MSNAQLAKNRGLLYLFFYLSVVNLLLLSSINLQNYLGPKKVLGSSTELFDDSYELQEEINFWKTFVAENPNYIDGWIQLADLEHQLGHNSQAYYDMQIAKSIDPNSEKVQKLEDSLSFFSSP